MFDNLRARLEKLLAEHGPADDPRARAAGLHAALVEAKVAVGTMRDALGVTERELAVERRHLLDAERRGKLAAEIGDTETVQVAERFAARHRERVGVLERKLAAQQEELRLGERDLEELTREYRAARPGAVSGGSPEAAWRDIEAAGGSRPDLDLDDALLRHRHERAMHEAAADAQLAHLKKKLAEQRGNPNKGEQGR